MEIHPQALQRVFHAGLAFCLLEVVLQLWPQRKLWFTNPPRGLKAPYGVDLPFEWPQVAQRISEFVGRSLQVIPSAALLCGLFVSISLLLLGIETGPAYGLAWFCLTALFHQNPMIVHSGDAFLRIACAVFAVASLLKPGFDEAFLFTLTRSLLLGQYIQALGWKLVNGRWRKLHAVQDVLADIQYARAWVVRLADRTRQTNWRSSCHVATAAVMVTQATIVVALLVPGFEAYAALLIGALHLGIRGTMRLGHLNSVCLVSAILPIQHVWVEMDSRVVFALSPLIFYFLFGDQRSPLLRLRFVRFLVLTMRWLGLSYTWRMFAEPEDCIANSEAPANDSGSIECVFWERMASMGLATMDGKFLNLQARKFSENLSLVRGATIDRIRSWAECKKNGR
ncbi:MAG TPA: hypothetical protein PLY87_21505 [Planctomycetaceae bacterium]|nr:hypothetical protein [Planctomycetaceae bacterium]